MKRDQAWQDFQANYPVRDYEQGYRDSLRGFDWFMFQLTRSDRPRLLRTIDKILSLLLWIIIACLCFPWLWPFVALTVYWALVFSTLE